MAHIEAAANCEWPQADFASPELRERQNIEGDDAWSDLRSRYLRVQHAIVRLGGQVDGEERCDALWEEQADILQEMSGLRARTHNEIATKLRTALLMTDESSDQSVRDLVQSAIDDLTSSPSSVGPETCGR